LRIDPLEQLTIRRMAMTLDNFVRHLIDSELMTADEWSAPENLAAVVNSKAGEASPCLLADGLTHLVRSNRPGGRGGSGIWMSRRVRKSK
jgi:hypothetical protein